MGCVWQWQPFFLMKKKIKKEKGSQMEYKVIHQLALQAHIIHSLMISYFTIPQKIKCFTFYPHPHKSFLFQTDKSEGEKHSSRFSETLLLFSSL